MHAVLRLWSSGDFLAAVTTRSWISLLFVDGIALVLLWSAFEKLRSPTSTANAFAGFGLTAQPSIRLAYALGAAEITLGVLLVARVTVTVTLAAVAAMFGIFTILTARSVLRGDHFSCGCFGEQSRPLSASTVMRAAALATLAIALLAHPPTGVTAGISALTAVIAAGLAALPLLGLQARRLLGMNQARCRILAVVHPRA